MIRSIFRLRVPLSEKYLDPMMHEMFSLVGFALITLFPVLLALSLSLPMGEDLFPLWADMLVLVGYAFVLQYTARAQYYAWELKDVRRGGLVDSKPDSDPAAAFGVFMANALVVSSILIASLVLPEAVAERFYEVVVIGSVLLNFCFMFYLQNRRNRVREHGLPDDESGI